MTTNKRKPMLTCPQCQPPPRLVVKTRDGRQLLACPRCQHTEAVPEAWRLEDSGQPRLF